MRSALPITRRRALQITAAVCGSLLLPLPAAARLEDLILVKWRGIALGARAEINLYADDERAARETVRRAVLEIRRLEAIFSLYMPDSAISLLNRDGSLSHPPLDLLNLISTAKAVGTSTSGAFDMTIQPLWTLYARHFARNPGSSAGPDTRDLDRAVGLVDYQAVNLAEHHIAFEEPGMAISLNGIAQGFITDRIADLLRRNGFDNLLVNAGEIRGVGTHPSGRPWTVGIAAAANNAAPSRTLEIIDQATATSAPLGTPLNLSGTAHHLFDPRTGACANHHQSITVTAATATLADAYSTAFSAMTWPDVCAVGQDIPGLQVDSLDADGTWRTLQTKRS